MPPKTRKDATTKTAILDSAERLMAEHGINGVSLRGILADADANPAALHYHFGSREALIEAVIARRGHATDVRRREILDEIESRPGKATVYDIVDAVVDPMLELITRDGEAGRRFLQFLARLQSDRSEVHRALEDKWFPDISKRLEKMITEACPDLPKAERRRRGTILLDAMLQTLANADVMSQEWTGEKSEDSIAEFAMTLKDFLSGGLSAPLRTHSAR